MRLGRVATLVAGLALAAGLTTAALAGAGAKPEKDSIWKDEPKENRPPWQRDLGPEQIERVLKGHRQRDPAKAKALAELRRKDEDRFLTELREQGRPEIDQIFRERWEARRQVRNNRFLEWLKVNYPAESQSLAKLRDGDPQVYMTAFDNAMSRYGYIFEAERQPGTGNGPQGRSRTEETVGGTVLPPPRREIRGQEADPRCRTQEVVSRRYDLIVRRKEIAYEQLLQRLTELQKQLTESKDDIAKFKDTKTKEENVRQRIRELTENKVRFKWD
jgi:hypothetical protein